VPPLNPPDEVKPKQQEGYTIMRTKALTSVFAVAAVLVAGSPAFARHEMREHVCDPRVENCRAAPSFETCSAGQSCMSHLRAPDTNSDEWPHNLILD
jgi:hypothetical protein